MRKFSFIERLIAVCCILAIMLSFPWTPVLAAAETDVRVTASTNTSVKQGNSAYTYVSIDSMESLSTLEVTVHYDPAVVQLTGSYNQVDALVYDSGSTESTLQYTYIFDGNGQNAKTQLFYFEYIVKKDAPVGQSYFDIVVGDAFDAAFNTLPVSGSRCSFRVAEAVTNLQCSLWGTSSVETAVNQEFTLTYRFSTTEIASGSVAIRFDPELFAVSEVIQGGFLTDKMTDINTTLSGAVYLSFLGAQYGSSDQLLSLRMKTLKNTSQLSPITVTVTDLYNLQLDPITCDGYTTPVRVTYDPTVDENAPYVFLEQTYDPEAQTVKVQVCLEENARLGAGDFVLQFDTQRLAYKSAVKGYNSTFFTINDKNTDEGLLKFSVISLTDITTAEILLTATFDVLTPCESTATKLQISGSGLSDHLTVPIVLNFTGCTVETAGHTTVVDAAVAPTCLETGLTEGSHCAVCQEALVAQTVIDALGHDEIPHEAKAPTCTEIGWEAYNTCSRCDYTTYQEIPANGHTFQKGVCVICGADQDPGVTWDVSAAADGSLMAKLYLNADGTYDLQLTGSGPMKNWSSSSSVPWYSYREKITGLRLPDGLTTIGDYAFNSFTALTEITLPESLESLGYMAFYQCTKLQQINFNAVAMNDLTEGNHVFSFCGQETNGITLRIGADVEKIPAYQFLPDTRDSYRPKLTAVEFEAGGNCLEIGQMAFYQCRDISRLQLPEGLQSIGYYAFAYCAGLESLTLPEGLMTIENYAFYACDALQEVELPGSLTQIGYCAFTGCSGLKKVTVLEGVTIIGDHAFYNCSGLQQLQLPASLTTIGSAAFAGCTGLRKLRLPETVTTIGVSAFNGCTGLNELQLPKDLVTIGSNAFVGCAGLTELHLPEGLQTIDYAAFSGCTGLTELTLPKSLRSIGGSAFNNCRGLTKINFNAANLADLADSNWVFAYAGQNGDGITVSVGSSVTKIPAYLFYPYSSSGYAPKIVAVEFAESSACQSIGQYAFYDCTDLRSLTLPESLQTIGNYAFYNCRSLIKINFNAVELADLKNGNAAFSYAGQSGDGITLTVGSSVTQIPAYLFYPLYSNSSYTPKVTAVAFEEGSSCRRIGTYTFYQSEKLTKICIPESVEAIEANAFAYCANLVIALEADTLPATLGNNWKGSSPYILGVDRVILEPDACYALLKNGSAVLTRYYGSEETYRIPDVVENAPVVGIHEEAFYGNTQLKAVQWPESLQTIGASAFSGCSGLKEATLPDGVQSIGANAFSGCTALESLTLPESLQTVGNSAFSGCTALSEIWLNAAQMTDLAYNNGVFYNAGKAGEGITLTAGKQVTRIPAYLCYPSTGADYTPKITWVVFEEGSVCQSIGNAAFAHNLSLQDARIPATVNRIEATAFGYCKNLILTFESDALPETLGSDWAIEVTYYLGAPRVVTVGDARYTIIGESYAILSRYNGKGETFRGEDQVDGIPVTVIDQKVFYGNTKLTAVTLPESLQHIRDDAFYGCIGLSQLHLPESLQTIGSSAFRGCTGLTELTLPESLLAIGNSAFYGCTGLESLTLPESLQTIGNYAFYNCTSLTKINYNAISLADLSEYNYVFSYAGQGGDGITVTVGSGVTRIPAYLFYPPYGESTYMPKLVAVEFAENSVCQSIGSYAFSYCKTLNTLILPESLQTIEDCAFYGCTGLNALHLPEGLQTIDYCAFGGCTGLTELTLPESLQTIGNDAFYNCTSLTKINYNAISLADLSSNNDIFSYAGQGGNGIAVTVGSSVTKIPAYLFYPDGGSSYTPKIVTVAFAEGSACQNIGRSAFYGCTGLNSLHLPEGLQTIGNSAFHGCTGLESLTLPESLQTIGNYAFYNCTSLTKINYNVISLADLSDYNYVFSYAGQGGDGITVTVGSSVTKIPVYLFSPYYSSDYAPKIVAVAFAEGSNCQSIGSYAFYGCTDLKSLTLPEGLQTIDYCAFGGCIGLETLTLPESLQTIGSNAFQGCTGLETLTLPESLQTIGSNAFQDCTGLESLTLPENLQTIGNYAFYNCTSLTKINYNAISLADLSSYNYVFSYAGQGADGITVTVGRGVTKLPAYLFYPYSSSGYAPKIVAVEFAEGSACQSIGDRAFYNCTGLTELTLPESLQTVGEYAFYGCTGLESLNLPESLQSIGSCAFRNCTGLKTVYLDSATVGQQLTSASAGGYLCSNAPTMLLPGDVALSSYLQEVYSAREQIIRDGKGYLLLSVEPHEWQEKEVLITMISCQRDGLVRYLCSHCGVFKDVSVDRHVRVAHEAKAPDCVNIGWHAYETCENCDYSTYAEIPALGHDPIAHEAKAQTCLAIGWEAYETCSRCDYSTYQEIPALGHDEIPHAAQAVTCLEIGWDAYVTCSRCDYSTYQEIPALGHGIIKHDALAPTCLEIGWDAYETCSRCDYSTYAELPATGHWVVSVQEKNDPLHPFTFDGETYSSTNHLDNTISVYTITATENCTLILRGKISSESNFDKLLIAKNGTIQAELSGERDWTEYTLTLKSGDVVTVSYQKDRSASVGQDTAWFRFELAEGGKTPAQEAQPTCLKAVVCSLCGEVQKEALGHDPVYSHTQQPTCLEVGYHVYACTRCDYIEKQEIAPLGHDLVSHEAKAPTCTEIGWDAYEACSRCSYTTYKEIPATGHSFVETFCTGCGMKQTPMQSWDVSAAGDGSLMAYLYQNLVDGGYELELEGSGTMKDYSYNAPWYSAGYCYSINRISLPEGLTYIGACAFQYCSDLRQIRIPDSVERIGNYVFDYSKNLVVIFEGDDASLAPSYGWYGCGYYFDPQKVILEADATYVIDKDGNAVLAKYVGNGNEFVAREEIDGIPVTKIGRYAFYQKTNLKTYWISEEINTIGDYAFGECNGTALLLESTQLPTSLGSGWNGNCDYYPGAQLFTENDFLFVKDQNDRVNLITYQGTESEITVPAQPGGYSITRIPNYAFYENRMLTRVVLPEGIVSVGDSAFASCGRLQEVVLPTSLEKIGSSAFQYCGALQSIRLPEGLQTIGTGAFWGCGSLTEISIPDSVTRLESTTFTDCSQLESVTLPKNLNYMGYMQFYGCPNLKELELPEGVHAVGSNSFYRCENLKVVYVRSSQLAAQLTGSGDAHEMIQNATTVVVPAGTGTDYLKETYPYCETRMRDGVSVDVYSSCAHDWQTEKISEYAQCVSDGYEVHTCSLCGVWTDDLTLKHAMETTLFAPTCTEDGYTLHTCADCGWAERTDPINKLGHERDYGGVLCNRCGEVACLLALKNGDSLFGCGSWQEAMNEAWRGNTLVLYGDITGDVRLYQTMRLDLNGHDIHGTLIVSVGATLYGVDSATDDFTGSYGSIAAITGNFLKDATSVDGKRYIALTDENGISFHRLQLQLHTVTLRTAKAGLYYKASMECDETLRNAITRHGVALSLERMPGADFKENSLYTWMEGAPTGDFTSGSVCNIFQSDLSPEENAARGAMKIYTNAYLQLADGTILMSDATTGDTVDSYRFDGVAWSMQDVLEVLNRDIDAPAYVECRQQILSFCEAWKDILSGWQLNNLTQ